jgi:RNA polymerase sigma factor (sigma-70 family)
LSPDEEAGLCHVLALAQAMRARAQSNLVAGVGEERVHLAVLEVVQDIVPRSQKLLAQDCLVMVVGLAKRVPERGRLQLIDLIALGNEALLKAAALYEPARGTRMSTWAFPFIKGAFHEGLRVASRLTTPSRLDLARLKVINEARSVYAQAYQRQPTEGALVTLTGLTVEQIRHVDAMTRDAASLDGEPFDHIAAETPAPDVVQEEKGLAERIEALIESLPKRDAQIVRWKHGIDSLEGPLSFAQIGVRLGSSAGRPLKERRVRDLYKAALAKLRTRPDAQALMADQHPF